MAGFGAKFPCFKAHDKETGIVIGKLVSANRTITTAEGSLDADDTKAEEIREFYSAGIPMETDDIADEVAAEIWGCKVEDGIVHYNKNDTPPLGALAYYKVLSRNNVRFYKAYYYHKAQAALGDDNAQTRGSNITFQTSTTPFTIFALPNGDWHETKTFDDEGKARRWICEKLSVTDPEAASYPVSDPDSGSGGSGGGSTDPDPDNGGD